jgi:hypothetical protein
MHKYDIQNMYDGSEYLQNILLKKIKKININIKSWHVFLSQHAMKNLQSMIEGKKCLKSFKCVT